MKPKQIVIDKDAFIGIGMNELCRFAKNHLLLVCDTLLYECATTSESRRRDMLSRCNRLIKAGAYFCQCSITYVRYEGRYSKPYPWFLPNMEATEQIQTGKICSTDILNWPDKINVVSQSRYEVSRNMLLDLVEKIKSTIDLENPDMGKWIRELPSDKTVRLQMLFKQIDKRNLQQVVVDTTPADLIKDKARFCLSHEWISWQLMRLSYAMMDNYYYLCQKGGPPQDKRAEHDHQDMEYVLLLSRADCLLTRDDKMVKPLAKAAFPDKDIFSSLDEMPEEYVCTWD